MSKINIFIQARMGSKRLYGKVLKKFANDKSLLDILILNLLESKFISKQDIIILTTDGVEDLIIEKYSHENDLKCFRGNVSNVLKRFYDASNQFESEYIGRICGDNPFIQSCFLDSMIEIIMKNENIEYISYKTIKGLPIILTSYGLFCEIFKRTSLHKALNLASGNDDFEHVTRVFYNNPDKFKLFFLDIPNQLEKKEYRFTIDTQEDFNIIDLIVKKLKNINYHYHNLIELVNDNTNIQKTMSKMILNNTK